MNNELLKKITYLESEIDRMAERITKLEEKTIFWGGAGETFQKSEVTGIGVLCEKCARYHVGPCKVKPLMTPADVMWEGLPVGDFGGKSGK